MEANMKRLRIVQKSFNSAPQLVFDIEVAQDHHYIIGKGLVSHNSGFIFSSSIVVSMNKRKLKEDADGKKTTEVQGIRSKIKCVKTRYAKPFEEVEINIPYDSGMDRYSGLFDMCEQKHIFLKDGNRYCYRSLDGTEHKLFRKDMLPEFYDMVMREWSDDTRIATEDDTHETIE
jgi:hypothetical protein